MATPYQGYDLVDAWQTHVGSRNGATPLAVVFHDEDNRPAVLLPLVTQSFGPFRIARFPGDKHSNMNMPLWRRDFAERATQIRCVECCRLRTLKLKAPSIDAVFDTAAARLERHAQSAGAASPAQIRSTNCALC